MLPGSSLVCIHWCPAIVLAVLLACCCVSIMSFMLPCTGWCSPLVVSYSSYLLVLLVSSCVVLVIACVFGRFKSGWCMVCIVHPAALWVACRFVIHSVAVLYGLSVCCLGRHSGVLSAIACMSFVAFWWSLLMVMCRACSASACSQGRVPLFVISLGADQIKNLLRQYCRC